VLQHTGDKKKAVLALKVVIKSLVLMKKLIGLKRSYNGKKMLVTVASSLMSYEAKYLKTGFMYLPQMAM